MLGCDVCSMSIYDILLAVDCRSARDGDTLTNKSHV